MNSVLKEILAYKDYWAYLPSPSVLSLIGFIVIRLFLCIGSFWRFISQSISRFLLGASIFAGVIFLLGYMALIFWYASIEPFSDHIEASVATISWIGVARGEPFYNPIGAMQCYNLPYGPIVFLANGIVMKLLSPSLFTAKLAGVLAAFGSVCCVFAFVWKISSLRASLIYTGLFSLVLLVFGPFSFLSRGDPLLLFCVACSILALEYAGSRAVAIVFAACLAMSFNIKIHAISYFLPVFVLLIVRFGLLQGITALFLFIPIAAAPFLLPNVSFANYMLWLRKIAFGTNFGVLRVSSDYGFWLILPLLWLFLFNRKITGLKEKVIFISLLVAMVPNALAGVSHLIPFVPLIIYLMVSLGKEDIGAWVTGKALSKNMLSITLSVAIAASILVAFRQYELVTRLSRYQNLHVASDIEGILNANPNHKIGMAYGGFYDPLSFYTPLLAFAGNDYFLDAPSIMDMERLHLDIPEATFKALDSCQTDIWLSPVGGEPFVMFNYHNYHEKRPLFSKEFRRAFMNRYELIGQSQYYYIYGCKR
jgi:hypothetical protein